jgi:hypothetical protein
MWSFITQQGLATAVVDFTNALSPLLVGLVGLLALSAAGIAWEALRAHRSQTRTPGTQHTPRMTNQREAA